MQIQVEWNASKGLRSSPPTHIQTYHSGNKILKGQIQSVKHLFFQLTVFIFSPPFLNFKSEGNLGNKSNLPKTNFGKKKKTSKHLGRRFVLSTQVSTNRVEGSRDSFKQRGLANTRAPNNTSHHRKPHHMCQGLNSLCWGWSGPTWKIRESL